VLYGMEGRGGALKCQAANQAKDTQYAYTGSYFRKRVEADKSR